MDLRAFSAGPFCRRREACRRRRFRHILKKQRWAPIRGKVRKGMKRAALSNEFLSSLCMELSLLLHAGIGAADGVRLLLEEKPDEDTGALLRSMADSLDKNESLSTAMAGTERFPAYVTGMTAVGERAGRLEEALRALSRYYEGRERLDRRLRDALLYPAVLMILMLVVIVTLLAKVLPVFNETFASLGGEMTGVAGGLLVLGRGLDAAMPFLCVVLAVAVLFLALFAASDPFRARALAAWYSRRGDHGVARTVSDARFAQALAMGMQSGLPVEDSVRMAQRLETDSPGATLRLHDCISRLEQGVDLAVALRESGALSAPACRMLALGIRSGTGDTVMAEIARRLEEDSEREIESRVGRVEPTLVIVTSILVGAILLSVMLPLMNIMAAIG